jgi:hypothetical protein
LQHVINRQATKEIAVLARATVFIYGTLCHLVFLATFFYALGFVGDLYVLKSIDAGTQGGVRAPQVLAGRIPRTAAGLKPETSFPNHEKEQVNA